MDNTSKDNNNGTPLGKLFSNVTETLNGDVAFKSTDSNLIDILFQSSWLRTHTEEISIGNSPKEKLFAMFMRDARYGIGARNVGRQLLKLTGASFEEILLCGRGDDIWKMYSEDELTSKEMADFLYEECSKGNELVKKWMPRYTPHNKHKKTANELREETEKESRMLSNLIDNADSLISAASEETISSPEPVKKKEYTEHQMKRMLTAKKLARMWGMNKQQYKKFVKCDTTENKLSRHHWKDIEFEHVPALALIKYTKTFSERAELAERYKKYIEDVKSGKKKMNTSVATVYDIYKARNNAGFEPDLWFDKLPKIDISALVVMDTSGSMSSLRNNDALGKALSICHYLSKNSSYCTGQFVTFSRRPELVTLKGETYKEEINSICGAHWDMNTDLGAVAQLLMNLKGDLPDWIVIVSDMQFDEGSTQSVHDLMKTWRSKGWNTKIVWWNLSEINPTAPETVEGGNIFMSGLSPMLLEYLSLGFDAEAFLENLLLGYQKKIGKDYYKRDKC